MSLRKLSPSSSLASAGSTTSLSSQQQQLPPIKPKVKKRMSASTFSLRRTR